MDSCQAKWEVYALGPILAIKPIQRVSSCVMPRMVRVSPRVWPGMRTSLSNPSSCTTRSEIGVGGDIDGASVVVGAGAGEGAAVGVGAEESIGNGAGTVARGSRIVIGKGAGAGAGTGAAAGGGMNTYSEVGAGLPNSRLGCPRRWN